MLYRFNLNEIQYLQKKYGYETLIGISKTWRCFFGVRKKLIVKGVLKNDVKNALSEEYKELFSEWEKIRYSIARHDRIKTNFFDIVLYNERKIITVKREREVFTVEIELYSDEMLKNKVSRMAQFDSKVLPEEGFRIEMPVQKLMDLLKRNNKNIELLSGEIGVSKQMLTSYIDSINAETCFSMFLSEDHKEGTGCLMKVVNTPGGICALRHVTPKNLKEEKMILVCGTKNQIISEICMSEKML